MSEWRPNPAYSLCRGSMRRRTIYRQRDNLAMLSTKLAGLKKGERVAGQRAKDPTPPTVIVIDDDPGVRESIGRLLRSAGFQVILLGSVNEFLDLICRKDPLVWCLMSASRAERTRTAARACSRQKVLPIVFITGTW